MLITELEGLKFPDEYVTRFYFKEGLDKTNGKVLELGCGNGNNLLMFYQYGWEVVGIDISKHFIKQAERNFRLSEKYYGLSNRFTFFAQDMLNFVRNYNGQSFDVLLLPNVICYLRYTQILKLFSEIRENKVIDNNSFIFIRTRSPQDYRYRRGKKCGDKTFKLQIEETGEKGCLNTFLLESELEAIIENEFCLDFKRIFQCRFDNYQSGCFIANSDIIFWGKVREFKK